MVMNYWKLSLFYFLFSLGTGSFQFLNLYYVDFGLTSTEVGTLFAIGPLVMVFSQPFWGILTDYLNAAKRIMIIMLIGTSTIALLFLLSDQFHHLVILNIAYFFFQSSVPAIADSTTISLLPDRSDFGKVRLWGSVGYAVGVLIVGAILDVLGFKFMFILNSFFIALTLLFIVRLPIKQGIKTKFKINEGILLFKNRSFLLFLAFSFLIFLTVHANNSFYGIHLQNVGASVSLVGFALLLKSILEVPFFAMSKRLMKRYSYRMLLSAVAFIYGIRWLIIGTVDYLEVLVWSQVLLSLSYSIQYFVAVAYVDDIIPKAYRATGQTFYWAVTLGLGGLVGNTLAGWVLEYIEIPTMYYITAIISLFSITLLWIKPLEKVEYEEV